MEPLELEGLRILKQEVQAGGRIRVRVIATNERASCPHCGCVCVKQHDVRQRIKRNVPLRGHRVELALPKRRFWCLRCHKTFTLTYHQRTREIWSVAWSLDGKRVLSGSADGTAKVWWTGETAASRPPNDIRPT